MDTMNKLKVLNLYGGPSTGKSTVAAGVFSLLKFRGVNCEYVTEYAKDLTWERNGDSLPLPLMAQEYVFAHQHYRLRRLIGKASLAITDSPLLLSHVYNNHELPSLRMVIDEAYDLYDNFNVVLQRTDRPYNPTGRNQTETEAMTLDAVVTGELHRRGAPYVVIDANEGSLELIVSMLQECKFVDF